VRRLALDPKKKSALRTRFVKEEEWPQSLKKETENGGGKGTGQAGAE